MDFQYKLISSRKLIKAILIGGLAGLALALCLKPWRFNISAQVGSYVVTKKMVDYRDRLILLDYPDDRRRLGKDQLVKAYVAAEILKKYGRVITEDALIAEAGRIDRNTLNSKKLEEFKAIFGDDRDSFLKVYVLPILVHRVIYYDFFLRDRSVQERSLLKVQQFVAEVKRDMSYWKSKPRSILTVSLQRGLEWSFPKEAQFSNPIKDEAVVSEVQEKMRMKQMQQSKNEVRRWIDSIIRPLRPGQVSDVPVDHGESWLVVRLLSSGQDVHKLEVISFPKENFSDWFENEKSQIAISF